MDLTAGRTLALTLMADHSLVSRGWTFRFDRAEQRLGLCNFTDKAISMGEKYVAASDADHVRQTMLHEIAHALVGPSHGHGRVWKRQAAAIGYAGDRTSENPHHDNVQAADFAAALKIEAERPAVTSGPITVGERVEIEGGRRRGIVTSIARTRCTVATGAAGKPVIIPIAMLIRSNGGEPFITAAAVTVTTRRITVRVGVFSRDQRVIIHLPGNKHDGGYGRVETVGPKNCVVALDTGIRIRCSKSYLLAA